MLKMLCVFLIIFNLKAIEPQRLDHWIKTDSSSLTGLAKFRHVTDSNITLTTAEFENDYGLSFKQDNQIILEESFKGKDFSDKLMEINIQKKISENVLKNSNTIIVTKKESIKKNNQSFVRVMKNLIFKNKLINYEWIIPESVAPAVKINLEKEIELTNDI